MMRYITLTIAIIFTCLTQVQAQMPYDVSVKNEQYTPLDNAIPLSDTSIWDDPVYNIPLGFNYKIGDEELNSIYFKFENLISPDTGIEIINGFVCMDIDLIDRGAIDSNGSKSPIRYKVVGTPGNRICKIEVFNAGFYAEFEEYGTLDDSINVQFWLYENGHKFEVHYGSSKISNPTEYFNFGTGPLVGYADYFNTNNASGTIYALSGTTSNPYIDSITSNYIGGSLLSYPAENTVISFSRKTLSVNNTQKTNHKTGIGIPYTSSQLHKHRVGANYRR